MLKSVRRWRDDRWISSKKINILLLTLKAWTEATPPKAAEPDDKKRCIIFFNDGQDPSNRVIRATLSSIEEQTKDF